MRRDTYSSGEKKTSAVSCGVVGQSNLNAVAGQLVTVGGSQDTVSLQPGVGNLATDVLVGASDDHAVLGRVVFVLGLNDETLAGIVVGLTLTTPAELDLEPLEVRLAFDELDERLENKFKESLKPIQCLYFTNFMAQLNLIRSQFKEIL